MSKGLFAHIIVSIIYIIMVLFYLGNSEPSKHERFFICAFFAIANWFVPLFSFDDDNFYKSKK